MPELVRASGALLPGHGAARNTCFVPPLEVGTRGDAVRHAANCPNRPDHEDRSFEPGWARTEAASFNRQSGRSPGDQFRRGAWGMAVGFVTKPSSNSPITLSFGSRYGDFRMDPTESALRRFMPRLHTSQEGAAHRFKPAGAMSRSSSRLTWSRN